MPKLSPERLEALRSVGVLGRRSGPQRVVFAGDKPGERTKAVTDELGNVVTEHQSGRVDVNIKAPHIRLKSQEVRDV